MNKVVIVAIIVVTTAVSIATWYLTRPKLEVKEVFQELSLTASIEKVDFRGDPLVARVELKNTSPSTMIKLAFPTSQRFNMLVYDESGRTVYNWSTHQTFKREVPIYLVRMEPGGKVTETLTWDLKDDSRRQVSPGKYRLVVTTPNFIYGYKEPGEVIAGASMWALETAMYTEGIYVNVT